MKHPGGYQALQTLGYATIWFGSSATISSLILIDQFGELPFKYAHRKNRGWSLDQYEPLPSFSSKVLRDYGTSKRLLYFQIHCESKTITKIRFGGLTLKATGLVALMLESTSIFTQIMLYTCLHESNVVIFSSLGCLVFAAYPILLWLSPIIEGSVWKAIMSFFPW